MPYVKSACGLFPSFRNGCIHLIELIMAQQLSEGEAKPRKLISVIQEKMGKNEQFFSLEFYPPKTFNGATNLMAIVGRLNEHCTPLFLDITWKPSQDPMSDKCQPEPSTLLVSAAAVDLYGQNIMIHIPSGNTTKSQVVEHLTRAHNLGIGSVLAVRGGISKYITCFELMAGHLSHLYAFLRVVHQTKTKRNNPTLKLMKATVIVIVHYDF